MIKLRYTNSEGKTIGILVHERIYVNHLIANGTIEIFFKSSPAMKPEKKPTVYEWSFKTKVTSVLNFDEVERFLKSMQAKKTDTKNNQDQNIQHTIQF